MAPRVTKLPNQTRDNISQTDKFLAEEDQVQVGTLELAGVALPSTTLAVRLIIMKGIFQGFDFI